jgi:hypothetical protein
MKLNCKEGNLAITIQYLAPGNLAKTFTGYKKTHKRGLFYGFRTYSLA